MRRAVAAGSDVSESCARQSVWDQMPRYYFNVCCESYEATDVVGEACPDDMAALSRALKRACEVVQQRLIPSDFSADGWIEVEDEQHREVLKLPLRAAAY
jgi:hypothetical protein